MPILFLRRKNRFAKSAQRTASSTARQFSIFSRKSFGT
jgi:hypothetical protein